MIYTATQKIRDKSGKITAYLLHDFTNNTNVTLPTSTMKAMLKAGSLQVINLQLTSDGRIVDKKMPKQQPKNYFEMHKNYMAEQLKASLKREDSIINLNTVLTKEIDGETKTFIFFNNTNEENNYLSNWYSCSFTYKNITFSSSEQYMMWAKAKLFKDDEIAKKILATNDFTEAKALGRQIRGFNSETWDKNKEKLLYTGLKQKFTQNIVLKVNLLNTGNATLAECEVNDTIWAIGLNITDENRFYQNKWNGQNLLGKLLMKLRNELSHNLAHSLIVDDSGKMGDSYKEALQQLRSLHDNSAIDKVLTEVTHEAAIRKTKQVKIGDKK